MDKMKNDYELKKGTRGYLIKSISNRTVRFTAHILVGNIMRKIRGEEASTPVIALATNCAKGMVYNWAGYLGIEFLADFRATREEGKQFHYAWLLLLIALMEWREHEKS